MGTSWTVDLDLVDRSRILRGWTQRELARRSGLHPDTVNDMLRGHHRPSFQTLVAVCRTLEVELRELITFKE